MLESARKMHVHWRVEEVREKYEFGDELIYTFDEDILYSDLNETITLNDLMVPFFESLGKLEEAKRLKEETKRMTYSDRITEYAKLLDGMSHRDLIEASRYTVDSAELNKDVISVIEDLYPTKLVIFSGLPQEVVMEVVNKHISPIYGAPNGEEDSIHYHGTLLELGQVSRFSRMYLNILTGEVERVMDPFKRHDMIRSRSLEP